MTVRIGSRVDNAPDAPDDLARRRAIPLDAALGLEGLRDQHESPDPKDDYLLALARASGVDALVSGDPHLVDLDLAGVTILTPRQLVERLPGRDEA